MREVEFALGDVILSVPLTEEEYEAHQRQVRECAERFADLAEKPEPAPAEPDYRALVAVICFGMIACSLISLWIGWHWPH